MRAWPEESTPRPSTGTRLVRVLVPEDSRHAWSPEGVFLVSDLA